MANQIEGLTPEQRRRYQLVGSGTTFQSAAQSFRKWWKAHECEIMAFQCAIGFLAILGYTTAGALTGTGAVLEILAFRFLTQVHIQALTCVFQLWVQECS